MSPILIPFISLLCLILWARSSTTIINKYAERGQPCLTPLLNLKKGELNPLFVTHASDLQYIVFTHLIKSVPKLKSLNASCMTSHLIVSKAFSKSKKAIIPFLSINFVYPIMSNMVLIFCPIKRFFK